MLNLPIYLKCATINYYRDLIEVKHEDKKLSFKMEGLVSNPNYSQKKCQFLLFINHRLVDSVSLRKALDSIYSTCLPKHMHPFIYLSLSLSPETLDVNVHPTKHEVHFLHEDAIIESIQSAVESTLLSTNSSRTYFTQTLLPQAPSPLVTKKLSEDSSSSSTVYAHQMVRTDSKSQKLEAFFSTTPTGNINHTDGAEQLAVPIDEKQLRSPDGGTRDIGMSRTRVQTPAAHHGHARVQTSRTSGVKRRIIQLTSVLNLREQIEQNTHAGLRDLVADHKFVGCVNVKYTLLQHRTKLYLVNTPILSKALFYQILMYDFGNFGVLRLSEPVSIIDLAQLALDDPESGWKESDGSKEELSQFICDFLRNKSNMLKDYFSIEVDEEGNLHTIPMLLNKYTPSLEGLPMYILRLATEVDWSKEQECFHTFSMETAQFFAVAPQYIDESTQSGKDFLWTIEHIIYPSLRTHLLPDKRHVNDSSILQIADLHDLYKVFERC